jgi:hypothetical protein
LILSFSGAGQNSLNGDDGGEEGGEEFISRSVRLFTICAVKKYSPNIPFYGWLPDLKKISWKLLILNMLEMCCLASQNSETPGYVP